MVYLDWAATSPIIKFHRKDYDFLASHHKMRLNANANYATHINNIVRGLGNDVKKYLHTDTGFVFFGGTATQLMQDIKVTLGNEFRLYADGSEHNAVYNLLNARCSSPDSCNLYAHMLVNNVTGEINNNPCNLYQDINPFKLYQDIQKRKQFLIVDLTASIGKTIIPPHLDRFADVVFWSTHKLMGEGNAGVLWISNRFNARFNFLQSYHQGTTDVQGAYMSVDAMHYALQQTGAYINHCNTLIKELYAELDRLNIKHSRICKPNASYAPILALTIDGIEADVLQNYLATKEIYVGVGASACSAEHDYRVLLNSGYTEKEASETIRVSFGESTTVADIVELARGIQAYQNLFL